MCAHEPANAARAVGLVGNLRDDQITTGVPRGRHGLYQRRVRARIFGEPLFEAELVLAEVEPTRPHVIAHVAWTRMAAAAVAAGIDARDVSIHSAYRSVALQEEVWTYRLAERRRLRAEVGLPELCERDLARLQMKWTARPGASAHHTGLALDLGLYRLGARAAKAGPAYEWLALHARSFGFYPYLPEGWHWEYNPPGLVRQLTRARAALAQGRPVGHLLEPPEPMPIAPPGVTQIALKKSMPVA